MSWLISILIGILTAAVCGAAACYLADLCVTWYRISSFEGGSGYFVAALTLLGLIVGLILGIVTTRIVAGGASPGFLRAQGTSLVVAAVLFGVIALFARLGGDVPPTIQGDTLSLEVELRCPRGVIPSPKEQSQYLRCMLTGLGSGNRRRDPMGGEILWDHASEVEGQWTIPCKVFLYTDRSMRLLRLIVNESNDIEFMLPLPSRPGKQHLQWSEWRTDRFLQEKDKSVTGFAYRFRVRLMADVKREADEIARAEYEKQERLFASLKPDSPLEEWLNFASNDSNKLGRIAEVFAARVAELPTQFRSQDPERLRRLTIALAGIHSLPPTAVEPLRQTGEVLVERVRDFDRIHGDRADEMMAQIRGIYWAWHELITRIQEHKPVEFRDQMQEILHAAEQHKDNYEFQALADSVRTNLQAVEP